MLLAELHDHPSNDLLVRLRFDGSFEFVSGEIAVVAASPEAEKAAAQWLARQFPDKHDKLSRAAIIESMLQAWWILQENKSFTELPPEEERRAGWRSALVERVLEIGWLDRNASRPARFSWIDPKPFLT
jgi:hypothetical protein